MIKKGAFMWEFAINVNFEKVELANSLFKILKKDLSKFDALVVLTKEPPFNKIVLAVKKEFRPETEIVLLKTISLVICCYFKAEFLNRHLFLPSHDEIGVTAFKKALINFDKETDYFLISKNLRFEGNLYLESFYEFKLRKLREKWEELIKLANENRDYLVSVDAFNDLLKFLIDNLDICKDEIDVIEEEDEHYYVCDEGKKGEMMGSSALVSLLIDLSPQKINFYYKNENHATDLLKTIFDRRINLKACSSLQNFSNITPILR